ncbi:hypothetical protein N9Q96_00500 [Flavobacteriaceae bacterium]|nr:hypothetical protein [Flavobacteriaceae bacterium]
MLNEYQIYENQVFESLSPALSNKGWRVKREYKSGRYDKVQSHYSRFTYDIALFHKDILCTFIEIRYSKNKKNLSRAKGSGDVAVRKYLNDALNYGILFINGELFIVGKNTSEKIKSFPGIDDYNWRNDSNSSFTKKAKDDYSNIYDLDDVNIYKILLEIERKKNIKLQDENNVLNKKVNLYESILFSNIAYVRESLSELELKVKLIDSHFNQYLNLSKGSKIFEDNYESKWCNNWGALEDNSKIFIIEAQNLYEYVLEDYTAYVQGLTKAFENEILKKIFCNFLEYYNSSNLDSNYKIIDSNNRGTIIVFRNFLKRNDIEGFLSLDQMRYIICAIFSDTEDKLLLIFRPIYLKYFKQMNEMFMQGGNLYKIKEIRNTGAHTSPINQKLADDFFQMFNSTFNDFINNYKFTN